MPSRGPATASGSRRRSSGWRTPHAIHIYIYIEREREIWIERERDLHTWILGYGISYRVQWDDRCIRIWDFVHSRSSGWRTPGAEGGAGVRVGVTHIML